MTVREAAIRFHITPTALYYHVNRGNLAVITEERKQHGLVQLVKAEDVQEIIDAKNRRKSEKKSEKASKKQIRQLHLYEIVLISCGDVTVLYKTCSHQELSLKYIQLIEHGHKFIRIRKDGQMLTIHESDKLANKYHPRTKGAAV